MNLTPPHAREGLREQRYAVDVAEDGERALEQAFVNGTTCSSSTSCCRGRRPRRVPRLRESGTTAPILMLTARDSIPDRVSGLDAGADDYLPSLFTSTNCLRVYARCCDASRAGIGDDRHRRLAIDTVSQRVSRAGRQVQLTARNIRCSNTSAGGRRGGDARGHHRTRLGRQLRLRVELVEVYVQRLRRKVDDDHELKLIRTRRGAGYTLSALPDDV